MKNTNKNQTEQKERVCAICGQKFRYEPQDQHGGCCHTFSYDRKTRKVSIENTKTGEILSIILPTKEEEKIPKFSNKKR